MTALQYSGVVGGGRGYTTVITPDGRQLTISGTRSTRNNNPGNIEYGSFARSQGAIGSDGRFAVFPDRATGYKAVEGLVFGGKYADLSLQKAIERYAPPFENNSLGYARSVANKVGVSLSTKMRDIPVGLRTAIAQAMAGVEGMGRAVVKDLQGNIVGRIDPRQGSVASALPDNMQAPPQRYQTVAAKPVAPTTQSIRTAANLGALPVGGQTRLPSQNFSAPLSPVDRHPLGPAAPRVDYVASAPVGQVQRSPLDPVAPGRPAYSSWWSPVGQAQAAPKAAPQPQNSVNSVPRSAPAPAPAITPKQVSAYTQYAQSRMAAPPAPVSSMLTASVPVGPAQTLTPQPAQPTFMPATPAPMTPAPVQQMPQVQRLPGASNQFPSAPPTPQYTAADVYAGRANSGVATGGNTVSRDQFGNTSVTNKYGVTTTTGPNGQQMASSGPGVAGPLGGQNIQSPSPPSDLGTKVRGGLGAVAGGGLGGLFAGPVGAALGAIVAGDLAKGRNPLDRLGIGTFNMPVTDQFGFSTPMRFANPKAGGPFPNAPTGAPGALGGRQSNRSDKEMRDISPRAADAISKGVGGLY